MWFIGFFIVYRSVKNGNPSRWCREGQKGNFLKMFICKYWRHPECKKKIIFFRSLFRSAHSAILSRLVANTRLDPICMVWWEGKLVKLPVFLTLMPIKLRVSTFERFHQLKIKKFPYFPFIVFVLFPLDKFCQIVWVGLNFTSKMQFISLNIIQKNYFWYFQKYFL